MVLAQDSVRSGPPVDPSEKLGLMLGQAGERWVSSLRPTQGRAAQDRRRLAVIGGNFVRTKVKEK